MDMRLSMATMLLIDSLRGRLKTQLSNWLMDVKPNMVQTELWMEWKSKQNTVSLRPKLLGKRLHGRKQYISALMDLRR